MDWRRSGEGHAGSSADLWVGEPQEVRNGERIADMGNSVTESRELLGQVVRTDPKHALTTGVTEEYDPHGASRPHQVTIVSA